MWLVVNGCEDIHCSSAFDEPPDPDPQTVDAKRLLTAVSDGIMELGETDMIYYCK